MATNENLIPIPGRLHSVATEGHVAGADEIYDDNLGITLDQLSTKQATTGTTGDYPYNGMGRVFLKKNMVNGVNTLTQAMINQVNTIYVIQYDFTLGEDITIPANCILEFDGGSISGNGTGKDTISPNNTYICSSNKCLHNIIISTSGMLLNEYIPITWVDIYDYTDIQHLIDYVAAKSTILDLCEQNIIINNDIKFRIDRNVNNYHKDMIIRNGIFTLVTDGFFYSTIEPSSWYPYSERICFENVYFIVGTSLEDEKYVFKSRQFLRVTFDHCTFYGVGAIYSDNFIQDFKILNCYIAPMSFTFMKSDGSMYVVTFDNTRIENKDELYGVTLGPNCIVVDCGAEMTGCSFNNCCCESCKHFIQYGGNRGIAVTNCYFEGNYDSIIKQVYSGYDLEEGVTVTGCMFSANEKEMVPGNHYNYLMDFIHLKDSLISGNVYYSQSNASLIPFRERGKDKLNIYFQSVSEEQASSVIGRTVIIRGTQSLFAKVEGSGTFKCYPDGASDNTDYTEYSLLANTLYHIIGSNDDFILTISNKEHIDVLSHASGVEGVVYNKSWKINTLDIPKSIVNLSLSKQQAYVQGIVSGTFEYATNFILSERNDDVTDKSILELDLISLPIARLVLKTTSNSVRGDFVKLSNGVIEYIAFKDSPLAIGEINDFAAHEVSLGRTTGNVKITVLGCGITDDGNLITTEYMATKGTNVNTVQITFDSGATGGYTKSYISY